MTHEQQSKDVVETIPKMKIKDSTVSPVVNTKQTTTTTTTKTEQKLSTTLSAFSTVPPEKLKPLVTHELSVVSICIYWLCYL